MTSNHLTRLSAVVPVLVEAGCPGLPIGLNLAPTSGTFLISLYAANILVDDSDAEREKGVVVARLEQWFNHTVVPWAESIGIAAIPPEHHRGEWYWRVFRIGSDTKTGGKNPDPTEAFVQCIEALTEVVKGGE